MIAIRNLVALPTADEIDVCTPSNRQDPARFGASNVHSRSVSDLHPLRLNALQLCEILMHSFGAARLVDRVSPMVGNCDKGEALSRPQTAFISDNDNISNNQRESDSRSNETSM
jgi:hypothetical protein